MPTHANRLTGERSPYLQQHAHNPVDWYPWGEAALGRAVEEDKPILLSVGYSACHWCHVMAHECFESEAVAELMNRWFVCIKVDREERPDLDHLYQTVCQMLTQQGGWPLTVFLTPRQEPFYAGTYFPPDDRYGRPGFARVLTALAEAWQQRRDDLAEQAGRLVDALRQVQEGRVEAAGDGDPLAAGYAALVAHFDRRHGGFGQAPKFPNPFGLELFLRQHAATGDREPLDLVVLACRRMRAGGVYDQLGGGFHRYSVDERWAVPHFEKMLYDNVLLPPVYLAAWRASGAAELAETARETLDYLLGELRDPAGGFYSTTDADSEGEEGTYFVWYREQLDQLLDRDVARLAAARFGVSREGNFERGATVLSLAKSLEELAGEFGGTTAELAGKLAEARRVLLAARREREAPFRDEKILTGWNGLAIRAFARAGAELGEPRYLAAAVECAEFLLAELADGDRLRRVYQAGEARIAGYLEDYAAVTAGLLELFCATGEPRWLERGTELTETVLARFVDPATGDLFMVPDDGEELVVRPRDPYDQATPSGTSLAVGNLVRLWHLTGDERYRAAAEAPLAYHAGALRRNAWGLANLIAAWHDLATPAESVVVAGEGPVAAGLAETARAAWSPTRLVARRPSAVAESALPELLRGKPPLAGGPAAYLCEGFTCRAPVTDAAALAESLRHG